MLLMCGFVLVICMVPIGNAFCIVFTFFMIFLLMRVLFVKKNISCCHFMFLVVLYLLLISIFDIMKTHVFLIIFIFVFGEGSGSVRGTVFCVRGCSGSVRGMFF